MKSGGYQMDAIFEYATEGIILSDKEGNIVLINPAAMQLFGYSNNEIINQKVEKLIPPKYFHSHQINRGDFIKNPSNRMMGKGRDLFGLRKDGTEVPLEISLSYYEEAGELFIIVFFIDITERKKSETILLDQKEKLENVTKDIKKLNSLLEDKVEQRTLILRETLQQLEKSQLDLSEALQKEKDLNEIKSRFVSMASHEFRTPLSTILSSASLISKYAKAEEQPNRDKHVNKIKEAVKQLNDLLEDFLSLGKLEEGKVEAIGVAFNVLQFAESILEELQPFKKPRQSFELQFLGPNEFITDKRLLKNILINLIGNAIKFSSDSGQIIIEVTNKIDKLEISISDRGIGISEDDKQHLFSSFFRGGNALNIQGTGLGLHIVKRYVEILKGDIQCNSKLDVGTTFILEIPAFLKDENINK